MSRAAALRYAEAGWSVFPLVDGSKLPATGHGFKDATSDPDRIAEMFNGSGNIGAVPPEDVVVVDIDGSDANHRLLDLGHDLPETAYQHTPRGRHYVYRVPKGVRLRQTAGEICKGVDTRVSGKGYIVVAPSKVGGLSYAWAIPPLPENIAPAPEWLVDATIEMPPRAARATGAADGPIGDFNATHDAEQLLERHGYKKDQGYRPAGSVVARYLAPDSESGLAGVRVHTDGRVYSSHSGAHDPLADGHSHDAFSIFTILEHGGDVQAAVDAVVGRHRDAGATAPRAAGGATGAEASASNSPTTEQLLAELAEVTGAGVAADLLRSLADTLVGMDKLARQAVRDDAIAALKGRVSSPAKLVDAALEGVPLYVSPGITSNHPTTAPELAESPSIVRLFGEAVRLEGVVGEVGTAQLLYLGFTSRLLSKPVSFAVKGGSSSGKSNLTDAVARFFPEGEVVHVTSSSNLGLVYLEDDLAHKTLYIREASGMREGDEDSQFAYFIRTLLSEGRIDHLTVEKNSKGEQVARRVTKEGPTNLVVTTTRASMHAENETRIFSLNTDDSPEQTKRVFLELAREDGVGADLGPWHDLQLWLAGAEHDVTIPYARALAEMVPAKAVRMRRDFGGLLSLIRTHAMLHQQTRDIVAGRVVATLDDYEAVRKLLARVIATGVDADVPDQVRETLEAVAALTAMPEHTGGVTAKALGEHMGLDKSTVSGWRLPQARAHLQNMEDKRGRPGRWKLDGDAPVGEAVLPSLEAVREKYPTEGNQSPVDTQRQGDVVGYDDDLCPRCLRDSCEGDCEPSGGDDDSELEEVFI